LHARVEAREVGDRRLRVLVLYDLRVFQRDRESEGVEPHGPDLRGIADEIGIHLRLEAAANRLVGEERHGVDDQQQRDDGAEKDAAPTRGGQERAQGTHGAVRRSFRATRLAAGRVRDRGDARSTL
jgi:hypothetical protein